MERKYDNLKTKSKLKRRDGSQTTVIIPSIVTFNHESRLRKRKDFLVKRKILADIMLFFGVAGVILMFFLIELDLNSIEYLKTNQDEKILAPRIYLIFYIRFAIFVTSIILVVLVFGFHWVEMHFFCINNSIYDWRISISINRICLILLECVVCFIHPFPLTFKIENTVLTFLDQVQYDVFLSLPMFARIFLLFRVMLLRSKLVNDTCSQSIGFLNKVKIDFKFYFKSVMNQHPDSVVMIATLCVFLIASWCIRACENSFVSSNNKFDLSNSIWFIAITFLTIGYGDVVPTTLCGRGISIISGLFGVLFITLLIAVITKKLNFSTSEKYVDDFVNKLELSKEIKKVAANIVKTAWSLHKSKSNPLKYNFAFMSMDSIKKNRYLLMNIQKIRTLRQIQRNMNTSSINSLEIYRQCKSSDLELNKLSKTTMSLEFQINKIQNKMNLIEEKLDSVNQHLEEFFNKRTNKKD